MELDYDYARGDDLEVGDMPYYFLTVYNGHWVVSVFFVLSSLVAALPLQSFAEADDRKSWARLSRSLTLRFPRLAVPALGANLFVVLLIKAGAWTSHVDPRWLIWWDDLRSLKRGPMVFLGTYQLVGPGWCLTFFLSIPFLASLACVMVRLGNRHTIVVRLLMYAGLGWLAVSAVSHEVVPGSVLSLEVVLCTILGVVIADVYATPAEGDRLLSGTRRLLQHWPIRLALVLITGSLPLQPWFFNGSILKCFAAGGLVMGVLWSETCPGKDVSDRERSDLEAMDISGRPRESRSGTSCWRRCRSLTLAKKANNVMAAFAPYMMTVYLWHTIVWTFCALHIMPCFYGTSVWPCYCVMPWIVLAAVTALVYHLWEVPLTFLIELGYDRLMKVGATPG